MTKRISASWYVYLSAVNIDICTMYYNFFYIDYYSQLNSSLISLKLADKAVAKRLEFVVSHEKKEQMAKMISSFCKL